MPLGPAATQNAAWQAILAWHKHLLSASGHCDLPCIEAGQHVIDGSKRSAWLPSCCAPTYTTRQAGLGPSRATLQIEHSAGASARCLRRGEANAGVHLCALRLLKPELDVLTLL